MALVEQTNADLEFKHDQLREELEALKKQKLEFLTSIKLTKEAITDHLEDARGAVKVGLRTSKQITKDKTV